MSSSSSHGTKKRKKKESIYEQIAHFEKLKWEHDDIYMFMMNKDTTKLDAELKVWRDQQLKKYPAMSKRFERNTLRAIEEDKRYMRIAKHGLLFLRIWLDPEYAKSFIDPKPRVNPIKFKTFYENHLDKCCRDLLNTNTTTLQAFVEKVRSIYIKL